MAAPPFHIDMRAQIRANMMLSRPDLTHADVILSLKDTRWRAVLVYFVGGVKYNAPTKEYDTPEEAMRVLLEDTSKHVYLQLQFKHVLD